MYNTPAASVAEVMAGKKKQLPALRVQYSTKEEFKSAAKKLGIMDDFKVFVQSRNIGTDCYPIRGVHQSHTCLPL